MSTFTSRQNEIHKRAKSIADLTTPLIETVVSLTIYKVQEDITIWDLSNKTLRRYLGYVAGVLDYADYVLNENEDTPRNDTTAIDMVFYDFIKKSLSDLTDIQKFLTKEQKSIESRLNGENNSGLIGLIEHDQDFSSAFHLGADDFANAIEMKKGWYPAGLFQLELISAGENANFGNKNKPNEQFSINPNFYGTCPDIKNGTLLKEFSFNGRKAILFLNCPMSNRHRLPWLLRLFSVKYKYVLAICSEKPSEVDIMITHERMLVFSVCLGGFTSDLTHHNFGPIASRVGEKIFVNRAFSELEKLLCIGELIYQEI